MHIGVTRTNDWTCPSPVLTYLLSKRGTKTGCNENDMCVFGFSYARRHCV